MKIFDGKKAAEDYMSMHTLAYSTPEMILLRFAKWLSDIVEIECKDEKCPNEDGKHPRHKVPRLTLYMEERESYHMDISDEFIPTGAITAMFGRVKGHSIERTERKHCIECGVELEADSAYCISCGAKQE